MSQQMPTTLKVEDFKVEIYDHFLFIQGPLNAKTKQKREWIIDLNTIAYICKSSVLHLDFKNGKSINLDFSNIWTSSMDDYKLEELNSAIVNKIKQYLIDN